MSEWASMQSRWARSMAAALVVWGCAGLGAGPAQANAIVVGHDINTLSSSVAGVQEATFAVNVATFLVDGSAARRLLMFESNAGDILRNFAPGVLSALGAAGFDVTVTSNYTTPYTGYDAIFVAQDSPTVGFLDNAALVGYVAAGGSVYLAGGVGPSPSAEAAGWSSFLGHYGLAYSNVYNNINSVSITSSHPIFAGVTTLKSGNGQSIVDLGTNPNALIVQQASGQNMYAVVNLPVPEPASGLLLLAGVAAVAAAARRRGAR